MQQHFAFGTGDIGRWQAGLMPMLDDIGVLPRRRPIGQLVKSLISGRTLDAVSLAAYRRLGARYRSAAQLAHADRADVTTLIAAVTFPEAKAEWLLATLRRIEGERPDFDLDDLRYAPLADALAWLERHPGVGRKVAASTLNASTLARPILIVDTHVLRVLVRLGFVDRRADYRAASEAATAAMPGWTADDFLLFHIACKRLGQRICRVEAPACAQCPLAADCPSRRD